VGAALAKQQRKFKRRRHGHSPFSFHSDNRVKPGLLEGTSKQSASI
jgi:hypothetical protein